MSLILVTGATGFLGNRIVRQLACEGVAVRATSRTSDRVTFDEHVTADLAADRLATLVDGCDAVVHAAGLAHQFPESRGVPTDFQTGNELTTLRLAQAAAAAGVKRFVLASSVSVYGGAQAGLVDETVPCRPRSDYARSKRDAEQHLLEVCGGSTMRPVILRLATLYGEGDRGNVARLMSAIDRGRFIWIGNGANRKSLLHVDDAARACAMAARNEPGELGDGDTLFNVAADPVCMREIVERLAAELDRSIARVRLAAWPARLALSAGAHLPLASRRARQWKQTLSKWLDDDAYCGRRFATAYQFRPQVDLASGILRQVRAYRAATQHTAARRPAA